MRHGVEMSGPRVVSSSEKHSLHVRLLLNPFGKSMRNSKTAQGLPLGLIGFNRSPDRFKFAIALEMAGLPSQVLPALGYSNAHASFIIRGMHAACASIRLGLR
jgi:hypothetical protein